VESPYHNFNDPTTRSTIITGAHPSVTREPEQDPLAILVQPRPSKTAMSLSPNAKGALNAFQYTLDILGKTPIPGIGAVTAALLQVVKGVQVSVVLSVHSYLDSDTDFICT